MATWVGRSEFVWRQSIARPRKHPFIRKNRRDISYTSRVNFVLNFLAMATGLVAVEFVWHHSIARPRRTPVMKVEWQYVISSE